MAEKQTEKRKCASVLSISIIACSGFNTRGKNSLTSQLTTLLFIGKSSY